MRRSICYCEPASGFAGEVNTWKFIYTTASNLPKGTKLRFDLRSKGRAIDWEVPSPNLKQGRNVIYGLLDNGKIVQAKEVSIDDNYMPQYEFILPSEIEAGENFIIIVGSPKDQEASRRKLGTAAQTNAQRRRTFNLYIDPTGKGNYDDPEIFTMDIRGHILKTIKVLAPSFVAKNKRFDVIMRFEDEYGNLTNSAPEDTLIELSYEHLRENLNWKLFVPETGFITLPNLYFSEPGVYTIKLVNTGTKEEFKGPPIRCLPENTRHLFWGVLHGESDRYDSTENIENCLRHFRDEKALNFFASSPFENQEETSNEVWKQVSQNIAEFDEADRFTTFIGFQSQGVRHEEGVRQFIYGKDHKQLLRKKDAKSSSFKKIYKSFAPKELISIPTFTMAKGYEYDFKEYDPQYERVVEIYNAWGSSECLKKEGNRFPISSTDKSGTQETAEGSIQNALKRNCRFGFVAGGLEDRGFYADFYDSDQEQYPPGLTAIISLEHSRNSLMEALYNRSCYATTGERMIMGLYIAGSPMGSEINTGLKRGLLVNRHLTGYAAGTTKLKTVEIIRNGTVIKTFKPDHYALDFEFDDTASLSSVVIDNKDQKPPFVYYYLRAQQEDGHMAWSSPIWIDLVPPIPIKREPKVTKVQKKQIIEDIEEEEEEEFEDEFDEE